MADAEESTISPSLPEEHSPPAIVAPASPEPAEEAPAPPPPTPAQEEPPPSAQRLPL